MIVTNETKLTQQAIKFADGANGSAHQEYSILADDQELGIKMMASRGSKDQDFTRAFFVKGMRYEKFEKAVIGAGHEWQRDS